MHLLETHACPCAHSPQPPEKIQPSLIQNLTTLKTYFMHHPNEYPPTLSINLQAWDLPRRYLIFGQFGQVTWRVFVHDSLNVKQSWSSAKPQTHNYTVYTISHLHTGNIYLGLIIMTNVKFITKWDKVEERQWAIIELTTRPCTH